MPPREYLLQQLRNQEEIWDTIIIGGGATGLGIALDSVSRGYKTLLLEQADFAKGTSSRSTKLVHGGVRYLAQGDFKLVREASIERGLLLQNAPHLVKNQTFIIPIYSHIDKWKYTIGLKLYDWIAGRLSMGSSVLISREKTLAEIPGIKAKGLLGGVLYHDGQFDDTRLAINLAQSISEQGGYALNYMKVSGLLKDDKGIVDGVDAIDTETGTRFLFKSKAVVNATGVFVDEILQMDKPGSPKTICVSQGVHLVLDRSFFPSENALMIPKTSDGRVLFCVPWHHKVVVGTTDTRVDDTSLEPVALEKEISFILKTAGAYLTKKPNRDDVLSVFAGLRPLAAPQGESQKTKEISRSHKIIVSPSKLFTIIGGKWTTYRKMAEEMMDEIEQHLGWKHKATATTHMHIHGFSKNTDWNNPLYFYGSDVANVEKLMNGSSKKWLSDGLKIHAAQVKWAVTHEMARTIEDVLARRTRALLLDAAESVRIAPEVASIMADILEKDEGWEQQQVETFTRLAKNYVLTHN